MIASIHMVLLITAAGVAAILATRHAVQGPVDAVALTVLTLALGLPLWITCDHYLLKVIPTVWWFDPTEPLAPYFLLYLPLSMTVAATPAAAVVALAKFCTARWRGAEQPS